MLRFFRRRRFSAAGVLALWMALPIQAEAAELTFSLGLRLSADSDLQLARPGRQPGQAAELRFGLGYLTETRVSRFSVDIGGGLGLHGGSGHAGRSSLVDPSVALVYSRDVGRADFNLSLRHHETDLDSADPVLTGLFGTGQRRTSTAATALNWGKDGPLGFGLSASSSRVSFDNAPGQVDYRTRRLGFAIRADLTEVTQLTLDLGSYLHRPDGGAHRRTDSATLGLNLQRPAGHWRASLALDDTPNGQRRTLRIGQRRDLPQGSFAWSLGPARGANGRSHMVGDLSITRDLPNGAITASLSRSLGANETTDAETVEDRLSLGWRHDVNALNQISLGASLARTRFTASGLSEKGAQITASWSRQLTRDWVLDAGYTHSIRQPLGSPDRRSSDRIHVGLRRVFSVRF